MHRRLTAVVRLALASSFVLATALHAQTDATRDSVARLAEAVRALREPGRTNGVPDFSSTALAARTRDLEVLTQRHAAIDTRSWPVPDRVDHLVVGTQLAALDFELRVSRPWARDPDHWVHLIAATPYLTANAAAADHNRLVDQLREVPRILAEARRRLTSPSGELAGMAIIHLEQSDGVNQGEPRRDPPPAGVIGWFAELQTRAKRTDPELVVDVDAALSALRSFRDWLKAEQPSMKEPAFVGLAHYAWYVRHVRLIPLSVEEIRLIGARELERARTLLAIEQHRNRSLAELAPVTTAAEHERRTRDAEAWIRTFTAREKLLTIPADIPATYETDAFFIDRSAWGGHRHFWEEITYRDPLNNHLHASIPGHRFDDALQRRNPRSVRRIAGDGTRAEGWAFYIEEMYLQAGLLTDRPRTRELFYIAQLKRAARIRAELAMQTGAFTLQQAIDYLVREVPLMEENLARYDLGIYLRRPAFGMNYTIGKTQLERLLADRQRQLGRAFDLGRFHDDFLSRGMIPISLIRWEMTGLDDEMKSLGVIK